MVHYNTCRNNFNNSYFNENTFPIKKKKKKKNKEKSQIILSYNITIKQQLSF